MKVHIIKKKKSVQCAPKSRKNRSLTTNKGKEKYHFLIDLIGEAIYYINTDVCFLKKLNQDLYTKTFDSFKLHFYIKKQHNLTDLPFIVGRPCLRKFL